MRIISLDSFHFDTEDISAKLQAELISLGYSVLLLQPSGVTLEELYLNPDQNSFDYAILSSGFLEVELNNLEAVTLDRLQNLFNDYLDKGVTHFYQVVITRDFLERSGDMITTFKQYKKWLDILESENLDFLNSVYGDIFLPYTIDGLDPSEVVEVCKNTAIF